MKNFAAGLLAFFVAGHGLADSAEREATKRRMTEGKALFEVKCQTVAGERIYKTVPDVEGVLLLKVRSSSGEREQSDWMWPGAAFSREATGDGYITTFLGYEYGGSTLDGTPTPVTSRYRGYISSDRRPGGLPGYRWVEVLDEKDGKRFRYTGSNKVVGRMDVNATNVKLNLQRNPNYDLNIYGWTLDKTPVTSSQARYGVTFEDHVIPEERRLGLASSTVKVLDLKTNEVLGEMIRYAWSPGAPSPANPTPWLTAYKCPGHTVGANAATRKFVDQVLIPAKEK